MSPPGALVLTDQRLLLVGGFMGIVERANVTIQLVAISSIDSHGAVVGVTTFAMGGARHRFLQLPEPLVRYVQEVRAWRLNPQPQMPTSAVHAPTRLEELERLARLHAQGVLSDDEFASEKARLLR